MATKPLSVAGPMIVTDRPMRLCRFDPHRLPDPRDYVDCLIVVNDRSDGVPRARLMLSNGASWDAIAVLNDVRAPAPLPAPVAAPAPVSLGLGELIPALLAAIQQPPMRVISPDNGQAAELAELKRRQAAFAEQIGKAAQQIEVLANAIDAIEQTALADVEIIQR